jgi:hypothetical protein
MDTNVVKFPYAASRRVHSQKPRRSKNGTPEERASKGNAKESGDASLVLFLQALKAHVIRELRQGQPIEAIFDGLEESYGRLERARRT